MQEFLPSSGCVQHVKIISHILYIVGIWGRVAREKPFSYNETQPSRAKFYKNIDSVSQEHIGKCVVLWINKVEIFGHSSNTFGAKTTMHTTTRTTNPKSTWQHHPNEFCLQLKEVWVKVEVYIIKPSKSVSSLAQTLTLQTETWSCQEIATLGTVTSIYINQNVASPEAH